MAKKAKNINYNTYSFWKISQRGIIIIIVWSKFGINLGWDYVRGKIKSNQEKRAIQLRKNITNLGTAFIKLGQILSCRPDLVPAIYLEELTHLQDKIPPFCNDIAYELIETELGYPVKEIYSKLSNDPIASASLGQVYQGRLKTGEKVAVKIQRPDLSDRINLDLYILNKIAYFAQTYISFVYSDLTAVVDELASRFFEEMDYLQEADNASKFRRKYKHLTHIKVPRIYWKYTSHKILTMEWIDGMKITDTKLIYSKGIEPIEVMKIGFQFSLEQILEKGLFHADPHPGNLLVTNEGDLAYLDFGMLSEIDTNIRYYLITSLFHLITGDFSGLAKDYVLLGFLPQDIDIEPLIPQLANIFGDIKDAKVTEFGFKQSFEKLYPLIYDYPFQMPSYYLLMLRCFSTLEGIAIKVDPNLQAFQLAYPYLVKCLFIESNSTLKQCLNQYLLQKNGKIKWQRFSEMLTQLNQIQQENFDTIVLYSIEYLASNEGKTLRKSLVQELSLETQFFLKKTLQKIRFFHQEEKTNLLQNSSNIIHLQPLWHKIKNRPDLLWYLISLFSKYETQNLVKIIIKEL